MFRFFKTCTVFYLKFSCNYRVSCKCIHRGVNKNLLPYCAFSNSYWFQISCKSVNVVNDQNINSIIRQHFYLLNIELNIFSFQNNNPKKDTKNFFLFFFDMHKLNFLFTLYCLLDSTFTNTFYLFLYPSE